MGMTLEKELETFQRELPRLLADPANRGQFALVHGDEVAGVYPTFDEARAAGYQRFELEPFMVKPIVEHEPPIHFARYVRCL